MESKNSKQEQSSDLSPGKSDFFSRRKPVISSFLKKSPIGQNFFPQSQKKDSGSPQAKTSGVVQKKAKSSDFIEDSSNITSGVNDTTQEKREHDDHDGHKKKDKENTPIEKPDTNSTLDKLQNGWQKLMSKKVEIVFKKLVETQFTEKDIKRINKKKAITLEEMFYENYKLENSIEMKTTFQKFQTEMKKKYDGIFITLLETTGKNFFRQDCGLDDNQLNQSINLLQHLIQNNHNEIAYKLLKLIPLKVLKSILEKQNKFDIKSFSEYEKTLQDNKFINSISSVVTSENSSVENLSNKFSGGKKIIFFIFITLLCAVILFFSLFRKSSNKKKNKKK